MRTFLQNINGFLAALSLSAVAATAWAQAYPSHTVTIIVPWPPGGPSDIAARPMAKGLSDILGQPIIIDNRGGAGGNIGTDLVTKAAPDGYTLLITSSAPVAINPSIYKKMPFNPATDLAPITNLIRVPLVLVVNPSVPAKNLQELLAYIKSKKDMQYASSGNGTPQHLTGELFKTTAKLDMVHIPYKGSAPAITDLLGGHVPLMFDSTIAILPHIKGRQGAGDRRHRRQALAAAPRRAYVRGSGHARLRVLRVVRFLRARQGRRRTSSTSSMRRRSR
jgi:tripartite-type tricarboxylate transporter receptor subunit TctC